MKRFLLLIAAVALFSSNQSTFAFGDPTIQSPDQKVSNIRLEQNYPNPANIKTYIKFSYTGKEATFKVYDVLGKLVEEIEIRDNTIVLDVSQYPDGIYLYTLEVDGQKVTRRMTVKHDR